MQWYPSQNTIIFLLVNLHYKKYTKLLYFEFCQKLWKLFSLIVFCLHNILILASRFTKPKMFDILPFTEIFAAFCSSVECMWLSLFMWTEVCLERSSLSEYKLWMFLGAEILCRQIK